MSTQEHHPSLGTFGSAVAMVAMLAISATLALLACEGLVRVLRPQLLYRYPRGLYVNDTALGYRLTPGFTGTFDTPEYTTQVRVNRHGQREDRDYGPKEPGVFRVLMVGDSFTMGHSVEAPETFVKQLQHLLNVESRGSPKFEVINAGVPGYNTVQEITYLENQGRESDPDLVVLMFFVGNDIVDNVNQKVTVHVEDGLLAGIEHPRGMLPYSVQQFLALHSHLYHLVWPYQRLLLRRDSRDEQQRNEAERFGIYSEDGARAQWAATSAQVERLAALVATGRSGRLAVVIIPDQLQVDHDQARLVPASTPSGGHYDLSLPSARVRGLFASHDIPAHDLLPTFRAAPPAVPLYFEQDGHLTRAGNEIAARAMLGFLRHAGLLPGHAGDEPGTRAGSKIERLSEDRKG